MVASRAAVVMVVSLCLDYLSHSGFLVVVLAIRSSRSGIPGSTRRSLRRASSSKGWRCSRRDSPCRPSSLPEGGPDPEEGSTSRRACCQLPAHRGFLRITREDLQAAGREEGSPGEGSHLEEGGRHSRAAAGEGIQTC
ncbi:uncharacterized protein LY79DRAFT_532404 [Colletotrichum navitas]|uniref:Uncharacterized protein n=1 Tax=Colletotrichum navitas TaxID=681940 RepID=A0AAD8VCH2_9PEZI|nr:uncharacterized protein LY79DRAFT_532404 [Colletotrichum navitas]KAK1600051.1 hypothetical protein LY79DRAFT_532404 [Colletotrichum navitas]